MENSNLFFQTIRRGNTEEVKSFLQNGYNPNETNPFGVHALTSAAQKGHDEIVSILLSYGADINGGDGNTPLILAIDGDYFTLAKKLIAYGADVNKPGSGRTSALTTAASAGNVEMAIVLIENGANVHHFDEPGKNALMASAREGHTNMSLFLINQGIDVNVKNKKGEDALEIAIIWNRFNLAHALMKSGANINSVNNVGCRKTELASTKDRLKFLSHYYKEMDGENKLILCFKLLVEIWLEQDKIEMNQIISTLVKEESVDINKLYKNQTLLMAACHKRSLEISDLLLSCGANPNVTDELGRTIIDVALKEGQYDMIKVYIHHKDLFKENNQMKLKRCRLLTLFE